MSEKKETIEVPQVLVKVQTPTGSVIQIGKADKINDLLRPEVIVILERIMSFRADVDIVGVTIQLREMKK